MYTTVPCASAGIALAEATPNGQASSIGKTPAIASAARNAGVSIAMSATAHDNSASNAPSVSEGRPARSRGRIVASAY
jgi:hypothetical protein